MTGLLNPFTTRNPFLGTNSLELVWGGILGLQKGVYPSKKGVINRVINPSKRVKTL